MLRKDDLQYVVSKENGRRRRSSPPSLKETSRFPDRLDGLLMNLGWLAAQSNRVFILHASFNGRESEIGAHKCNEVIPPPLPIRPPCRTHFSAKVAALSLGVDDDDDEDEGAAAAAADGPRPPPVCSCFAASAAVAADSPWLLSTFEDENAIFPEEEETREVLFCPFYRAPAPSPCPPPVSPIFTLIFRVAR